MSRLGRRGLEDSGNLVLGVHETGSGAMSLQLHEWVRVMRIERRRYSCKSASYVASSPFWQMYAVVSSFLLLRTSVLTNGLEEGSW